MFKVFLTILFFFMGTFPSSAQQNSLFNSEDSQENLLSKYTNARAICARMTDPHALHERGMLLITDQNDEAYLAAADCFMSAAMRNHTPSQIELGKMYEFGKGVSQSNIFAYKWYQTAVLLGDNDAVNLRNSMENRMTIDDITLSVPMIQNTLDLLDQYNSRREADLEKHEQELSNKYRENFNINLADFDPPAEEQKTQSNNPLIEALIQSQLQKEALEKKAQTQGEFMMRQGREPGGARNTQREESISRRRSMFDPLPVIPEPTSSE